MRFFTELQEAGVLAPDDAADVIDNTKRLSGGDSAEALLAEEGAFLKVKTPGDKYYREIPFGMQSYLELRNEIASKFEVKPSQLANVYKEPDILIADDDDCARLTPGVLLEFSIKR